MLSLQQLNSEFKNCESNLFSFVVEQNALQQNRALATSNANVNSAPNFKVRSVEQLQSRFYSLQKILLRIRVEAEVLSKENDTEKKIPDLSKHVLHTHTFDSDHESSRKNLLSKLLNRKPDEELKLIELALEYRQCEQSIKRIFYDYIESDLEKNPALKTKWSEGGVHKRTYGLPRRDPPMPVLKPIKIPLAPVIPIPPPVAIPIPISTQSIPPSKYMQNKLSSLPPSSTPKAGFKFLIFFVYLSCSCY